MDAHIDARGGDANDRRVRPRRRTLRAAAALACAGALGPIAGPIGCGVPVRPGAQLGTPGALALLGVTRAPGVDVGLERAALEAAAAAAFDGAWTGRLQTPDAVRDQIDPARLDAILDGFGASGALVPDALQSLMAAPIEHRRALLLRVEENVVERLDPSTEPVSGRARERRVVQAVRRRVRVAATRVDLNGGAVGPLGTWTTSAEARTEHVAEGGDGFVASVAATLAGRMAGRPAAPPPPPPPPVDATLRVLFEEIARELPGG